MSNTSFSLASGSFAQNWTSSDLISADDNWSGVPSIEGYRGDDLTTSTGTDPRTISGTSTVLDVNANQTNPTTFTTGGVAEFAIANPTIALNGSGTADAPYIVLYLDATGRENIQFSFTARDLDASADNAVQQIAVHYRVGGAGTWTNLPAGYIADASTGPSLATQETLVSLTLPAAANGAAQLELRVMTTNAAGNDEWIGIDDLLVTSQAASGPVTPVASIAATDAAAAEALANPGTFRITLSSAPSQPLSVHYTLSGSAAAADYTPALGDTAVVPAGQTFVDVTIVPVDDGDVEPSETLTLTLLDQDAYDLGSPISATVTIADNDVLVRVRDIQGTAHLSPFAGQLVAAVPGIVTALAANGFYLQDPLPDANPATSEAVFVFTSSAPTVAVGDAVSVAGTVQEFRPSNNADNLTVTEIASPTVTVQSSGNALPAATLLGAGGRALPSQVIYNDAPNNVETPGDFDPATEGIDFWESLEGMRVQVQGAETVSPTIFNTGNNEEIWVLADGGAGATGRTARGGSLISANDFNPERIQIDDLASSTVFPALDVGTALDTLTGVVSYNAFNYEVLLGSAPVVLQPSPLRKEVSTLVATRDQLTVATFNVENLDPGDGQAKFDALAAAIVGNLRTPDIVSLEEVQDNNGPTNNGVVDANLTLDTLLGAITAAGGPAYQYRQINPGNNQDGGEPGGNIRVVFLFNPARVGFVDGSLQRLADPNLADGDAFANSRKPLVGDFTFNGSTVTVVGNHFASKGGDDPLFGPTQPPVLSSEPQRLQQAEVVKNFVQGKGAAANVIVAGDLNDFEFSAPVTRLESGGLTSLVETLPASERYSYNFEGNAQTLDHLLASASMLAKLDAYDVVHINSEFATQVSDHDPVLARFNLPAPIVGGPARETLVGGPGDDVITGGGGRDVIDGGGGRDRFVYTSLLDFYDTIVGFQPGFDRFDIAALLASVGYAGTDPVADGLLSVRTLQLMLPFSVSLPMFTLVMFDADGSAGAVEPARPMAHLVGVAIDDAHVLIQPGP